MRRIPFLRMRPTRRFSGRRWRLPFLLMAAVTVSVASVSAPVSARANGPAHQAAAGRLAVARAGGVHYGKPIIPRVVNPRRVPPGRALGGGVHVQGVVPPSLRGGKPASGLPRVISDPRSRKVRKLPGVFAATGSFAALESLTGATFANTCTLDATGTCNGAQPPDTQMAAGQNQIVEAVNNNLFVFGKDGTQLLSEPLSNIFQPPSQSVGLTDPKILFDPATGRYYMTEMVCQNGGCGSGSWTHMGISLAISSNPAVSWSVYDYLNDTTTDLQDQPKLGFSGDKITFAVNDYSDKAGNTYKQENVVVIQKSDAVAGNTITPAVYTDATNNSGSTYLFDSMPTTPVNASTSDNTQYVVWDFNASSNDFMKLIRITGTPNAHNVDFTGNVTQLSIANQTAPPAPLAKGGNLCSGTQAPCSGDKQNFQSAMVQGNDLWAVATDGCTPQYPNPDTTTRSCTRLVELDLGNNSIVTDSDIGTDGTYRINPSVSKDSTGHVFFGFTISDSSTYGTAALDASALPVPAVLQRIDFAAGDVAYGGNRWGDYSGTQQDPADTSDVWTAQEFGGCSSGCNPNFTTGPIWATALGQFTFRDPHITSISPAQGPVTGGTTVDIYGSEFANGGTTVKFGGNTSPSVTWLDSTHIQAVSPAGSAGTVDVTAAAGAGTSDTSPADQFTYIKVPTTTTYTGPTSGDYHDPVSLSATLTNNLTSQGVAGKTISFSVGAESCSATTDASGVATCPVTLADLPGGAYNVQATFAGDATYEASGASSPFAVNKEETTISYTSGTVILAGASNATLKATLVEDGSNDNDGDGGSTGLAGQPVTLSVGSQSCLATTDASGNASCPISSVTGPLGPQTVGASFAGDAHYQPATATKTAIVFAFPSTGVFTLGDLTVNAATPSTTVTWWSNNWYLLNILSGGTAPSPFKGFVGTVTLPTTTPANVCSGTWSTSGGNSPPPPATVPSYMGVIVASKITKAGNKINGNYIKIVVVKTNPGYAPGPQNSGTGTIVATFCG
jgi:IPT/TIG domain/Bacterial Ig-like domain (group 3)